jgi:hypothetical protein
MGEINKPQWDEKLYGIFEEFSDQVKNIFQYSKNSLKTLWNNLIKSWEEIWEKYGWPCDWKNVKIFLNFIFLRTLRKNLNIFKKSPGHPIFNQITHKLHRFLSSLILIFSSSPPCTKKLFNSWLLLAATGIHFIMHINCCVCTLPRIFERDSQIEF